MELFIDFRRPVTKSLFRHYRVLGKGGFGEVNNAPLMLISIDNMADHQGENCRV